MPVFGGQQLEAPSRVDGAHALDLYAPRRRVPDSPCLGAGGFSRHHDMTTTRRKLRRTVARLLLLAPALPLAGCGPRSARGAGSRTRRFEASRAYGTVKA